MRLIFTRAEADLSLEKRSQNATLRHWFRYFIRHSGAWLSAITVLVFISTSKGPFLPWGDTELFSSRMLTFQGVSSSSMSAALRLHAPWDGCYGPLDVVSHILDFQLFGSKAWAHHLTNVWLHVLNVALLFSITKHITRRVSVAALAAALFAVHPMQVPSVAWISQRRILFATTFALGSVLWGKRFANTRLPRHLGAAVSMGVLAGLCLLPAAAVLLAALSFAAGLPGCTQGASWLPGLRWSPFRQSDQIPKAASRMPAWTIRPPALIFVIAVVAAGLLAAELREVSLLGTAGECAQGILGAFSELGRSVWHLIWPIGISPSSSVALDGTVWAVVGLAAMAVLIPRHGIWNHRVFAGLVWFLLCSLAGRFSRADEIVPVLWSYMGSAGLAFALACAIWRGLKSVGLLRILPICAPVSVMLLTPLSRNQIACWNSAEELLPRVAMAAAVGRPAWRAWHALGLFRVEQGKDDKAHTCFRHALTFKYDGRTLLQLARIELRASRWRPAKLLLAEVLREGGPSAEAEDAFGWLAKRNGDWPAAARHFSRAVADDPCDLIALTELAMVYAAAPSTALRDGLKAIRLAERALQLTGGKELRSISAAAAAHAELNQFSEAERLGLQAMYGALRLGDTNETTLCAQRLRSYRAKRPWREPRAVAPQTDSK